jgi:hypothetical protein
LFSLSLSETGDLIKARFLKAALAMASASAGLIETTHPRVGVHTDAARLAGPQIARAYTSHEPLTDGPLEPALIAGRVSVYKQHAHVWTQMLNAEHKDHALDVDTQTRKSAAAIIAAREQWTTDWIVHYADAVNGEKLTAALCFGKHVPMPNDDDAPLTILNTYAS